ncbi:MAG: Glucose-6-phosphate isomerase [Syntrophorhabdus sp. PtaU1.Bin058]|nr:MAG: Glucose-6-phosphate isomerase [Syntrophorhabdus sp. PtaU1.Bin058]
MNLITLDITNSLRGKANKGGLEKKSIYRTALELEQYNKVLWKDPYGFMGLPESRFQFDMIKRLAGRSRRQKIKNLVILGIGGSSLGTQTIFEALLHPFHNYGDSIRKGLPRYFILDNIDPHTINRIVDIVRKEIDHTLLVVISKSGETPETISQFMIFKRLMEKSKGFRERIILITDQKKGVLKQISDKEGYDVLNVPEGVGGRFSVLTPVGLFPSAVMGIDIDEIAHGAMDMSRHIRTAKHTHNMAIVLAAILYLMDKSGRNIHVIMPYCARLSGFADWFRQLEAESLGKGSCGPTPAKSMGVTDQHSQLQLYVDGPRDKCIMLLYSAREKRLIPKTFPYIDGLDYLAKKDLNGLFHAELLGTTLSLTEAGTPNFTILLDDISAYSLGALFFLYEMAIAYLGRLYTINPFDQPGVELGKIYTKAIMGKAGLEKQKKAADRILSAPKTVITF